MVLLKRFSPAPMATQSAILGTAINQDGHTNGISLPNPRAGTTGAASVRMRNCPKRSAAHGTDSGGRSDRGHALAEAFGSIVADAPLAIGSIKTNLGH
jgi:acyl transferase domain-containing protein